jgi:replicative DNA helicase
MLRSDLEQLAERSLLRGLIENPAPVGEMRGWLRPGDFADTWHRAVYTAVVERHVAGEAVDPQAMSDALTERLGPRLADRPRFAALITAMPYTPNTVAYGRMVLDAGLRRELVGLGVLLRAAAVQSAVDRTSVPLTTTCNLVDVGLDAAASRWAAATGAPQQQDNVVPLALRAAFRNGEAQEGAARYLDAHPGRDAAAERSHVVELVGALIAHPEAVAQVASWLPIAAIGDLGWRLIYGTTIELTELGEPVDLVTVAWAARQHAQHGPALPSLEELGQAVEAGWYAFPTVTARTVATDQARRLADTGAHQLQQAAANPGVLIGDLVDTGHTITAALRRTAAALPVDHDTTARVIALPAVARAQELAR